MLRAAVGIPAAIQGGIYLADRAAIMWLVGLLAIASGALLLIGFLTPAACAIVGVEGAGIVFSWFPPTTFNLFDTKLFALFLIIIAAAIVLLGPGAFSLDARVFGRREIIIPQISRPPKL